MAKQKTLTEIAAKEQADRARADAFERAQSAVTSAEARIPRLEAAIEKSAAQVKLLHVIKRHAEQVDPALDARLVVDRDGMHSRRGGLVGRGLLDLIAGGLEFLERAHEQDTTRLTQERAALTTARRNLAQFENQ